MKTIVNDVEITPEIATVLREWFHEDAVVCMPAMFVDDLNVVQDILCRVLIDPNMINEEDVKTCISFLICIKDEFKKLTPLKTKTNNDE